MYDELEIKPFKLPVEGVLTNIERSRNIKIERDAFVSQGYYNCNHPKGKHCPVFHSNNGDGGHIPLVEIDKLIYVVGKYPVDSPDIIYLSGMNEGRKQ